MNRIVCTVCALLMGVFSLFSCSESGGNKTVPPKTEQEDGQGNEDERGEDDEKSDENPIKPAEDDYALQASMQADASLVGKDWQAIHQYMRSLGWDYSEHPNIAGEADHAEGVHCEVVEDGTLKQYVFKFTNHAGPEATDGDRGKYGDRQRNEMKSRTREGFHQMNGNWNEWQRLEWKFKIPAGFRPSTGFTHIHQLKAQEGNNGMPILTITPRANADGSKRWVQVIHSGDPKETWSRIIVDNLPLEDFEDQWVQATTVMHYTHDGYLYVKLQRVSDGKVLVEKDFSDIDMWRKGAVDIRSKFGIYRSFGRKMTDRNDYPDNGIKDESLFLGDFKVYEASTNPSPSAHD